MPCITRKKLQKARQVGPKLDSKTLTRGDQNIFKEKMGKKAARGANLEPLDPRPDGMRDAPPQAF